MGQEEIKDKLTAAGVEYDKGLERFMGNTDLYYQFLKKFLYDGSYEEFDIGIMVGDLQMAEKSVHTLKGTAGNLSLVRLYNTADVMVKALRAGAGDEEIKAKAKDVSQAYRTTCDAIREALDS